MRPKSSTPSAAKMKKSRKKRRPRLPTSGSACITVSSRARTDLAIFSSFSTDNTPSPCSHSTYVRSFAFFIGLFVRGLRAVAFLTLKSGRGLIRGQHKCGRGQRLEVYVRSSFVVVNLHDLWSKYSCSTWHVILAYSV